MTDLDNKLRGGYYTPETVTRFICDWAITSPDANVLEPSCGDGAFIVAANRRLAELGCAHPEDSILGVEFYEHEAKKAAERGGQVIAEDFFTFCSEDNNGATYDAIVGNPPFIRYQDFEEGYRSRAFGLMRGYDFSPNRLTNIWLPFLVVCCHLLKEDGRLGMVIPAELFQVKYAAEARRFLMGYFENVTIVTFTGLLFDGAQQEVVLLLAERQAQTVSKGVRVIEAKDAASLAAITPARMTALRPKRKLPDSAKWQAYYLNERTLDLISELRADPRISTLSDLADVNVGLVSGQNSFFVIDEKTAKANGVERSCVPIISRSFQLEGLAFTEDDFKRQLGMGRKVLLYLPGTELSEADERYVRSGVLQGVNENYKCRIRTPWYEVPTSWKPEAFFYRQVGSYPRMVLNEFSAYSTDTLHKVRFHRGVDAASVVVSFNNSLTFLISELTGRSYGGGVLTFEPTEARSLPLPLNVTRKFDLEKADAEIRGGRQDELIRNVDNALLGDYLGLSSSDIKLLHEGWVTLRDRRMRRKKR